VLDIVPADPEPQDTPPPIPANPVGFGVFGSFGSFGMPPPSVHNADRERSGSAGRYSLLAEVTAGLTRPEEVLKRQAESHPVVPPMPGLSRTKRRARLFALLEEALADEGSPAVLRLIAELGQWI